MMAGVGQSLFVVKLDGGGQFANGTVVPFGGAREVAPRDIAHGSDGARYVVGEFIEGSLAAGPSGAGARANAGDRDIFITKISATGAYLWGRSYGGAASDYAWTATGVSDGVLVSGLFASDAVDFGSADRADRREAAAGNLFVSRLGADGQPRGLFALGPRNRLTPALVREVTGGFYLGGVFSGPVDFNTHPQDVDERSSPTRTGFVSRYTF
jgi:hypothetical protein